MESMTRFRLLHLLVSAILLYVCTGHAADSYPSKALRIVVPFPAGSTADVRTRQIAKPLAQRLGQSIIVENKPGASGTIGNTLVAKAPPDGYTLLYVNNSSLSIAPYLLRDLAYDSERDFAPITLVATAPAVLVVHPSFAANSVRELAALARTQPGKLTYGASGIGSAQHLPGAQFARMANIELLLIPYKGDSETMLDLVNDRLTMSFATPTATLPHLKADKLKALAVTSVKRLAILPNVPTMQESGFADYEWHNWFGYMAPAATSPTVIARLHQEIAAVMQSADLRTDFLGAGYEIVAGSPEQFTAAVKRDQTRYRTLIRAIGLEAH
jgi:tripartite-type tricarboxylate transporter receptor subunit TctC